MELQNLCMGCMAKKENADRCPRCGWVEGTEPESPLHLTARTVLNEKYLIGRVLGQGGFGITYLGWDLNLNLKLAIKEYLPQDLASRAMGHQQITAYTSTGEEFEYGLNKFLEEARTLAQFDEHPNIVSVRDFFRANGTAYIVMSYLEGMDLKDYVAEQGNRLTYEKAMAITMPVLDALKEIHAVNVLHRDISPDNIFIKQNGQVILIDFGAARQAISAKGRSMSIILKPGFTPEEQYRSKGVQGPWTDLYAVAASIYRIITGQMPPESLDRLAEDTLVPPSQLGVKIGANEERALLKAMAVKAEDRFKTVEEFQEALLGKSVAAGPAAAAPPPEATWHISRDGARFGPYTWERMVQMAGDGNVGPHDLVWNKKMGEWQRAAQIQGLIPASYPYSRTGQQPAPVSWQPPPVSYQPGPVSQQPGPVSYQPGPGSQQAGPVSYQPPYQPAAVPRKRSPVLIILGVAAIFIIAMFLYKGLDKGAGPKTSELDEMNGAGGRPEWWYDVEEFQFYESHLTDDYPDDWQGISSYNFSTRDSFYIYFVVTLSHPAFADELIVPASFCYYDPEGEELAAHDFEFLFETGETESVARGYFGWDQPGEWLPGLYHVEMWLDGASVALGYFEME